VPGRWRDARNPRTASEETALHGPVAANSAIKQALTHGSPSAGFATVLRISARASSSSNAGCTVLSHVRRACSAAHFTPHAALAYLAPQARRQRGLQPCELRVVTQLIGLEGRADPHRRTHATGGCHAHE